jgi:hypothetical protein
LKPWIRPAAACAIVAVCLIEAGRLYDDSHRLSEARRALASLASIQEAYRADHGIYASDLGALAEETRDALGFVSTLDQILDLDAGLVVRGDAAGYHLEARARNRAGTVVVLDGPPRLSIAAAGRLGQQAPPSKGLPKGPIK